MNRICITIAIILFSYKLCGQTVDGRNLHYELKYNIYNALYYDRDNEITIKYDTIKYPGDILLDLDTLHFRNVIRISRFKYKLSIFDKNDYEINNPTRNILLSAYYKENDKLFKLKEKQVLLIDTNTWYSNLTCDNYIAFEDYVYKTRFLSYLAKKSSKMLYFVKNDQIMDDYKYVNYCVSCIDLHSNNYTKACVNYLDPTINQDGYIINLLLYSSRWCPIYIENIEVIKLNGDKMYFPPMSFHFIPN